MVTLVVHHRVRDYDEIEHRLYQDPYEPNRVVIHNDFASEQATRGLLGDPSLNDAMTRGGVTGEPGVGTAVLGERKVYEGSAASSR